MKRVLFVVAVAHISFCWSGNLDNSSVHPGMRTNQHVLSDSAALAQEKERFNVSAIDAITGLYTQIVALPIPEILDLLEEIVGQFDEISTNYELNNSTLSWSEWAQKYWWMPPVIIVACAVLYLRYKKLSNRAFVV